MSNLARHISRNATSSQNVMVRIATGAVAVSVAVVIISLSVIFGFKEQISALVSGAMADVTVSDIYSRRQPELFPVRDSDTLRRLITTTENVAHTERYALRGCVARGENGAVGIMLKGIGEEADISTYAKRLHRGAMPRFEEARRKEILLTESVAKQIGASENSRIELLLIDGDNPRREVFKVCGIYRSALGETGAELALTDIRNVQKLNGWEQSQISGYACRLDNSEWSDHTAAALNLRFLHEFEGAESVAATSSREEYPTIFGWLETHDINAIVIAVIMLVVAVFNMITAILILVLERTRMVGILKSMGMQNGCIRRIFTYRAARIIAKGAIIGNIVAFALLLAQRHLHIVKLDESGYFLSEVPVAFGAGWIVSTNIIFVVLVIAATSLATSIVGRIKVAEAIKYS